MPRGHASAVGSLQLQEKSVLSASGRLAAPGSMTHSFIAPALDHA
jgi:hypothetical protein